MSRRRSTHAAAYPSDLRHAIAELLPRRGLAILPRDRRLRWVDRLLVFVAILMAYSAGGTLLDRFDDARRVAVAMHSTRRRPGRCYRGFAKALATRSAALLAAVAGHLRALLEREAAAASQWLTCGFAVFGVDSTKLDCPMTRVNEESIGVAGRRKTWPQLLLTSVFHVGSNVPWAFARGDARASERAHLLDPLLATLPARRALLLADAGFVGYEFFAAILASERHFLVRIGANVRLLRGLCGVHAERRGGDVVWVWPCRAQKKDRPPLKLRLVTAIDPRRNRRIHLLTSVLDPAVLSDAQVVELYAMRWSVELKFRSLKQVMGRRKLHSDAPESARVECDWSAVGHWMLELMSWRQSRQRHRGVASSLRAAMRGGPRPRRSRCGARSCALRLAAALRASVPDTYRRTGPKDARHWPNKKRDKPPGDPLSRTATPEEMTHAARLVEKAVAA